MSYVEYTRGLHEIAAQRARITALLERDSSDGDGGDGAVLDGADLQRLVTEHGQVADELRRIRAALGVRDER